MLGWPLPIKEQRWIWGTLRNLCPWSFSGAGGPWHV